MKPVAWLGDSRERLREFPTDAARDLGYQLEMVQRGDEPRDWNAFQKKSRATAKSDIELAARRMRAVLLERKRT